MVAVIIFGSIFLIGLIKNTYYYIIKDKCILMEMEIMNVKVATRNTHGLEYDYDYKYMWKGEQRVYTCRGRRPKEVGDTDYFLIDPHFGIVYRDEYVQDWYTFMYTIGLIIIIASIIAGYMG